MSHFKKTKSLFPEGELFNKIMKSRFNSNQNILSVITGGTGSGKSYQDLRRAELWYAYRFNEPFPEEHICFSLAEIMNVMVNKLKNKTLRKGDVFILEESGVNLGSLDFQQKIVKFFNYTLQSFRSLNTGIFFNLPHLNMLSKQARMLIHYHFVTSGIDPKANTSKSKLFHRQVNQHTGKVYAKLIRVNFSGKLIRIDSFKYKLPSPELRKIYEAKKFKFVVDNAKEYSNYLNQIDRDSLRKQERKTLTDYQQRVYTLYNQYRNQVKVAELMGINQSCVSRTLKLIENKGYGVNIGDIT